MSATGLSSPRRFSTIRLQHSKDIAFLQLDCEEAAIRRRVEKVIGASSTFNQPLTFVEQAFARFGVISHRIGPRVSPFDAESFSVVWSPSCRDSVEEFPRQEPPKVHTPATH